MAPTPAPIAPDALALAVLVVSTYESHIPRLADATTPASASPDTLYGDWIGTDHGIEVAWVSEHNPARHNRKGGEASDPVPARQIAAVVRAAGYKSPEEIAKVLRDEEAKWQYDDGWSTVSSGAVKAACNNLRATLLGTEEADRGR